LHEKIVGRFLEYLASFANNTDRKSLLNVVSRNVGISKQKGKFQYFGQHPSTAMSEHK